MCDLSHGDTEWPLKVILVAENLSVMAECVAEQWNCQCCQILSMMLLQ